MSHNTTQVLTDSHLCVQAYNKLYQRKFLSSTRVCTFFSVISRHHVIFSHISGAANIPSDYTSRNRPEGSDTRFQICKFCHEFDESVVRDLTVKDVIDGSQNVIQHG